MKVTINISKKDLRHLEHCYSHLDACNVVTEIIRKIKKKQKYKKEVE